MMHPALLYIAIGLAVAAWFYYDFAEPYRTALHAAPAKTKAAFIAIAVIVWPIVLLATVVGEIRRLVRWLRGKKNK